MHITVFGAAGWVGRAALANLAEHHEIRSVDRDASAWDKWKDVDGPADIGETVHLDIRDYDDVNRALEGTDAVLHLTASFPDHGKPEEVGAGFGINVLGLWNVLECCRRREVRRIVHMGSCQIAHPRGLFFESDVRRADGSPYAVTKRLQEEMCRQFHEAFGSRIIVLRPSCVVDSRIGISYLRSPLGQGRFRTFSDMVCRHDLAEACRLALETQTIDFDILHIVGMPEADETCNTARARQVLSLRYRADLEQYRSGSSDG